jgi:diguanylate cyclase (GGDEF)-like protein
MRNERGRVVADADCPIAFAIRSRVQWLRRMSIRGRERATVIVDAHTLPVQADDGSIQGAILLMRDASQETSLEERCQDLHELATRDPLTELANRAEFDKVHPVFMDTHVARRQPCSLIICDIDRFKSVNDNYGHQAGDAVIQSFARVLKGACRSGDLAARYGGEEFVLLCASCVAASATARAEEIRTSFAAIAQPVLEGATATASFGVTSFQAGDTAETMLRRADRALLKAKDSGRNRVVQLGTGVDPEEPAVWRWWRRKQKQESRNRFFVQRLKTDVPFTVTLEKLRGFIADHHAEVVSIDNSTVKILLDEDVKNANRRTSDRPVKFTMELQFTSHRRPEDSYGGAGTTRIHVSVDPQRTRDRRRSDAADRARRLLVSLRAYLMATVDADNIDVTEQRGMIRFARHLFTPLLGKRPQ